MFKSSYYMNDKQQSVIEDFTSMVETEYALCVQEIKKTNRAIVPCTSTYSEENNINLYFANREINSISKYWQLILGNLIEFIETKNPHLNKEIAKKYLKHE